MNQDLWTSLCRISGDEEANQGVQDTSSQQRQQQRDDIETFRRSYLSSGKLNFNF